jgi:hypothetical protein
MVISSYKIKGNIQFEQINSSVESGDSTKYSQHTILLSQKILLKAVCANKLL